jgi:membrane-associated phospholipid phosphatase
MKQRRYGASLAAFSMSALLFGAIAVRVIAIGPVCTIDSTAMIWAHVQAAPWLTDVMLGVTYLGGPSATSVYAFVLVGYLLWRRRFSMALIVTAIVYGGMLLNVVIKHAFERARPAVDNPVITLTTYSFPSGHAAASTIFAGLLCVLAIRSGSGQPDKTLVIVAATIWVGMVCASRVYLGLHYVTDVLAGVTEGVAWLALSTLVLERFGSPAVLTPP